MPVPLPSPPSAVASVRRPRPPAPAGPLVLLRIAMLALPLLGSATEIARAAPAAPVVTQAATSILKVRGTVEGADVYVNGIAVGKTPFTTYLPPGSHQIRVVADGFDPYVRKIELIADRTLDVNAALTPGPGTLEFNGPAGAHVFLDGTDRGPVPIRLPAPSPGVHEWRVEAPLFETAAGRVDFVAGRNFLLDVKLASSAGIFVIESRPAGARVLLDGREVGVTPLRLDGIGLGKHGVQLVAEGRATVTRSVDTSAGVRGEVKATLADKGAALVVTTGSDDAKVFLNDAPIGEGSTVRLASVEKGRARLRVVRDGRESAHTIVLPARGTVSLKMAGDAIVERKPLTRRWGFWAAVGGGVAAGGAAAIVVAAANAPEPAPTGDTVVALP